MRLTLRWTSAMLAPTTRREHDEDPQDRPPRVELGPERRDDDAQQGGERADLDDRGHEAGHRRRRPLVDVGRPEVEGHRGDLEGEADEQQRAAGVQETRAKNHVGAEEVRDRRQVRRSGRPVDQGGAVDEDRRGEPAEQEVLERRLGGLRAVAVEARPARRGRWRGSRGRGR